MESSYLFLYKHIQNREPGVGHVMQSIYGTSRRLFNFSSPKGVLLVVSLASVGLAPALQVRGFTPSKHERFTGFPAAPVRNPGFIHAALNLSGVGWSVEDPQKQFTLISPLHFAGANHFRPSLNSLVSFVAQDGAVISRQVIALTAMLNDQGQATDVLIGTLGAPVLPDSGVAYLPYLNLDAEAAYVGQPLIVLGRDARGGRGTIAAVSDFGGDPETSGAGIHTTRTYSFNYRTAFGGVDDSYAEVGDSGSPGLVAVGGRAAMVGTHTAVLTALGTITTVDSLLPAYAAKINTHLSADGYHLTQVTPKAVAPTIAQRAPSLVRAGYPFSVVLPVTNPSSGNEAHNLKLNQQWSTASSGGRGSGDLWIQETVSGSQVQARRGGLSAGNTTEFAISTTLQTPGIALSTAQLKADGVSMITSELEVRVVESYRSWSRPLTSPGAADDPDGDGVDNLSEYAFGGDPEFPSLFRSGTGISLVPVFEPGGAAISWVQRRDAADRALGYVLESSISLAAGAWETVTPAFFSASVLDSDFERVTATLPADQRNRVFFRVEVVLTE